MSRLFISHSSRDNVAAVAFKQWLRACGWADEDIFLDLDSIGAGERWKQALNIASARCEAVILLASPESLASPECVGEVRKAEDFGKEIVVVLLRDLQTEDRRLDSFKDRQIVDLAEPPQGHIETIDFRGEQYEVRFNATGLARVEDFLQKRGITPDRFAWPPPDKPNADPFPGLSAFAEDDAGVFFGRDADIVRGLDRLRILRRNGRPRLLVIQAASGAGKSSYLRAGLWPRLVRDADFAPLAILRPAQGILTGPQGLGGKLAAYLSRPGQPISPGEIHAQLMAPDAAKAAADLVRLMAAVAATALERRRVGDVEARAPALLVAVDQAEELFGADDKAESDRLLKFLASLMREPPADVALFCLFTIRADGAAQLFQAVADLDLEIPETLPLLPLPQTAYRDVIAKPLDVLARGGQRLTLAAALADRLVADATGADALPLLAFTISHLYREFAATGSLTLEQYDSIGGVAGSIDMALKQALARPGDAPTIPTARDEQFALLRATFIPWLARVDPATGAPRRRAERLDEFPPPARALVQRLIEARLLVADRRSGADVVEIAHESLLRQWPALTAWLQADADDLKVVDAVERAAGEWARNGRQDGWLDHRAERLVSAERVALREDFRRRLGDEGLAYLHACRASEEAARAEKEAALARERERLDQIAAGQQRTARLQRRARWALAAVAAAVIVGLGVGAWQHMVNLGLQQTLGRREVELDRGRVNFLAGLATLAQADAKYFRALRFAALAGSGGLALAGGETAAPSAHATAASVVSQSAWLLNFVGHGDIVWSASFNPDGRRIVTASADKTARIWDTATGAQLAVLAGHDAMVYFAAFSPDGKRIVTASRDKTARIWDAETGKQIVSLDGHTADVMSAAFSPDGSRVVTGSVDETARIWDAASGHQLMVLSGHDPNRYGYVQSVAFSSDGTRIVTGSADQTARIWDAASGKQLIVLRGHSDAVTTAAFSPDGARIVTASNDKTARIWNAVTGDQLLVLRGHEDVVWCAAFSADGERVVTTSTDRTARIWDAGSGKALAVLRGHEDFVQYAGFSPDGARIVTASRDRTARLWDARAGKAITVLGKRDSAVLSAAFSPDGAHVVTASKDRIVRIWDAAGGGLRVALRGHADTVWTAAFSPDGKLIVTASKDQTARIWDAATGTEIRVLAGSRGEVMSAAFSPDGKRVVTASKDKTARIWDAATGEQLVVLTGHDDAVQFAAFSPDGTRVVTASNDKTAAIWDAAIGKQLTVLRGHDEVVYCARFSTDGRRVITASKDKTARIWDAASGRQIVVLRGHSEVVNTAAFSPDGTHVVTASDDKTADIWDAGTGKLIASLRGHADAVFSAVFSFDGARIVTASADTTARIWDAAAAKQVVMLGEIQGDEIFSALFNPDGTRAVTSSIDGTARIWDAASGKELLVLRGHGDYVQYASFSPDGTRIVTASHDKTARLWDAAFGKQLIVLQGHQDGLTMAAFSPDGQRIATASRDKTARIWNANSGNQLIVLQGHQDSVNSAVFSPDGGRIVTASDDKTALIWDAASGKQIAVLRGHGDLVTSAAFSPDGARVVTASRDGTARIWDAASGKEIMALREPEATTESGNGINWAAFSPDGVLAVTASADGTARIWDAGTGKEILVLLGHDSAVIFGAFGPDGAHVITASTDGTARIWDAHFATMSTKSLVAEICQRRLRGFTVLTRDDMRLAGYADDVAPIDGCGGAGSP